MRGALPCWLALASLAAPAHAQFDPAEDRGVRVAAESGFGLLGGAGGALTVGLLSGLLCSASSGSSGFGCIAPLVVGGLGGAVLGIWLGTFAGGELAGGNGGLGWTLLGTATGGVLAGSIMAAADGDAGDIGWVVFAVLMPLTGSVLGYELSTTREGPRTISTSLAFPF